MVNFGDYLGDLTLIWSPGDKVQNVSLPDNLVELTALPDDNLKHVFLAM